MSGAPSPRIALALVVALPFIACSEQSPPLGQTETDAGFAPDDGGEAADAGSTATPDAGHPADAGQVADAGVDIDAGTAPDAGVEGTGYGWNAYLGAHYGTRPWARGGLRDPAGAGSNGFRPVIDGADILDDRLSTFETRTLPVLAETLAAGGSVVLQAAGGESYWQAMELPGGRAAFEAALRARVDLIQGLPGVGDWTSQVVFQFGNEIQNPERFYGEVCSAATGGVETNCDFATAFAPYYVDHLLAPGAEILRAKSQELFGRPDAIRVALGSVVNLVTRRTFVEGLLERDVGGDLAPTLAGQRVARFVDTVTIHYTMPSAQAPEVLDDFFDTWTAPSADSAVRALWMTEEVGVRAASSGEGLAVALRSFVPAQRWWRARGSARSRRTCSSGAQRSPARRGWGRTASRSTRPCPRSRASWAMASSSSATTPPRRRRPRSPSPASPPARIAASCWCGGRRAPVRSTSRA